MISYAVGLSKLLSNIRSLAVVYNDEGKNASERSTSVCDTHFLPILAPPGSIKNRGEWDQDEQQGGKGYKEVVH